MILPFVRELFADVEKSAAFVRAVTQVKGGAGRIRVSGLTPTGKALFYSLLHRATSRPLIVTVSDNRALDELLPVVRSLAELTGARLARSGRRPARLRCAAVRESFAASRDPGGSRHGAVEDCDRGRQRCRRYAVGGNGNAFARCWILFRPGEDRASRRDGRSRAADRAPAHRRLQPGGRGRDAGRVRASRRLARRLSAGVGPAGSHRAVRRRGRIDPQVRSRNAALCRHHGGGRSASADRDAGGRGDAGSHQRAA